jgi:hypothetical protein
MNRRTPNLRSAVRAALDPFLQLGRLMAFCHRGENLPTRLDSQYIGLVVLSTAIGCYRWCIETPSGSLLDVVMIYLVCPLFGWMRFSSPVASIAVMACIGMDTTAILLDRLGIPTGDGPAYWALIGWCLAVTLTTANRWRMAQKAVVK